MTNRKPKFSLIQGGEYNNCILLSSGKSNDLIFKYGTVRLIPSEKKLTLSFNYNILQGIPDENFKQVAGDILVELLNHPEFIYSLSEELDANRNHNY